MNIDNPGWPYDNKYIIRAILDENGNSISQDEFPLDEEKFVDLYEAASEAGEAYTLFAFEHEGKTIVFTCEIV